MDEIKRISKYIREHKEIELLLGNINELKQIGQGGNGLVYKGKINGTDVAIKFLILNNREKILRFKAEYFNIMMLGVVSRFVAKYINYEKVELSDTEKVHVILMKYYPQTLKSYRNNKDIDIDDVFKLTNFLLNSLKYIHDNGIIHRDLKPENIFMDEENNFFLADFGIAKYDESFVILPETKNGERMGNYLFSAPEQAKSGVQPSFMMDIYAMGQILQWFITGETHKGTGRKSITEFFNTKENNILVLDNIIAKSIANNPIDRFQSINDIFDFYETEKNNKNLSEEEKSWKYLHLFNELLRKSYPKGYGRISYISDTMHISRIIDNLKDEEMGTNLWFHTGYANNQITQMEYDKDSRHFVFNEHEVLLKGIWLYFYCDEYDDLILLDTERLPCFEINGKKLSCISIVNKKYEVDVNETTSGYIKIESNIIEIVERKNIDRHWKYKYCVLGTEYHCSLRPENDKYINRIQNLELNDENINALRNKISANKDSRIINGL